MLFKRRSLIDQLLDTKNKDLYNFVNESLTLSIVRSSGSNYGAYCKGKIAIIYIPAGKPSPSSFAHELLHLELKVKGVNFSTKLSVSERPKLIPVFSESLSDHITNVLEHRKMFPRFMALGYEEVEFLSDARDRILEPAEVGAIIKGIKRDGQYYAGGIDTFIGMYLAARCSCFSFFDYSNELQSLRSAEPELSSILDRLVSRWDNYDIEKEGDPLSDSYLLISFDFLEEVENWVKSLSGSVKMNALSR